MDFFDVLLQVGLITTALVGYLLFFRRSSPPKFSGNYREAAWNYPLRLLFARYAVTKWKSQLSQPQIKETPLTGQLQGWDCIDVRASATDGSTIFISVRKLCGQKPVAEAMVYVKLPDGTTFKSPHLPDTLVGPWEDFAEGWVAGGLKIQELEPHCRLRILYNGLLIDERGTTRHVKFNFIWTSATMVLRHPLDWSNKLAAQALALEPWRNDRYPFTLSKWGDGSWLQFGTVQGRILSFDSQGVIDKSVYLRTRGVRERLWSKSWGLHRSVTITVAASDGTAVHLKAFSYKDVLTLGYSGSVRFPDYSVHSITDTDFALHKFCENSDDAVPSVFTINITANGRHLKLVLQPNVISGKALSGAPYAFKSHYYTMSAIIDGYHGTGLLERGYEATGKSDPVIPPSKRVMSHFQWQGVAAPCCLPLEAPVAAAPDVTGGKGASLALLIAVQDQMGYRVPPGYCLTTTAFEKHLETNPLIREAIKLIETAAEQYVEQNFKEKCDKAVHLLKTTEITGELKREILSYLPLLRQQAFEQNLGADPRFAVRSSAVGEDSESLSAAGQNETVLGCVTDEDVLRGVRHCWGSMFAFTSAHYRRVNGQPCLCACAVVIQALVKPRAAGVMFTRHPQHGDPTRLLITANYGLGESVVSGSVDPDTIIVSRPDMTITSIQVGSKKQRVLATGVAEGVSTEEVPDRARAVPCLSVRDALRLAAVGVAHEDSWGKGRDVEWAFGEDDTLYLLQSRPITSLERWSEEELLHEFDHPIMADDELITFANTGEVMPKPLTALTHCLVFRPLTKGCHSTMGLNLTGGYDLPTVISHNHAAISLYNSLYRRAPEKVDLTIRILDVAVQGRKVADDNILSVAQHRRPPSVLATFITLFSTLKTLLVSKRRMKHGVRIANSINIDIETENPLEMLDAIAEHEHNMFLCSYDHGMTSSASVSSQFIAMMVLLEGGSTDFTDEQRNEMNVLLSSGGVLSAEVPQSLASITRKLEASGKAEDFRAQNPKEALKWLRNNLPEVHEEVSKFLKVHGHRAYMEFDLSTKPWSLVPEEMMAVLQNMRVSDNTAPKPKSDAEILASLKTPKKSSTKKILRWILPLCKRTVRHREETKAHIILIIHKLRLALLRLARLMVRQWLLPEEELIWHFHLRELRNFITSRDPALLKKAVQRKQYYTSWCKLKFSEINTGWVEPLDVKGPIVREGDVTIKGASVCGGEVVARACVVKDLSEIGDLQHGDILITHSTDIGWSPYFPLLSGIVTELGGLISHGAVIARECGLPCIVGAQNATDIFRTGDTVRLCGSSGLLQRVIQDERNS